MALSVTDVLSNVNDQIANAAGVLKRSPKLRKVFEAIYSGGPKPKSVQELVEKTKLNQVEVSQQASKLHSHQLVGKEKLSKTIHYSKLQFIKANRSKILSYALNPRKLKSLATKVQPNVKISGPIRINTSGMKFQAQQITCDDIDQFKKVKSVKSPPHVLMPESQFKEGMKQVVGEEGEFNDWGGEANDLYTTNVSIRGKRLATAFAFKGPGKKGPLTPGKLGKNGDQIQRLMESPAQVFFVQYHDKIEQSVVVQMQTFALLNSVTKAKKIFYGIIDGKDSDRLIAAYPNAFRNK